MGQGCRLAPGVGQVPTIRQPGSERTNWYNLSGATLATSIKITHFIPSDPVIPVLGIRPTDIHTRVPRNTYSTVTAASFVTAVDWKQPNYTACGDSLNNDATSTGQNSEGVERKTVVKSDSWLQAESPGKLLKILTHGRTWAS